MWGNCYRCGAPLTTNDYDGLCYTCRNSQFGTYYDPTRSYNYKCPDCNGEFNQPSIGYQNGTYTVYKCPFCGKDMKGM